jgi:hypothetical protein
MILLTELKMELLANILDLQNNSQLHNSRVVMKRMIRMIRMISFEMYY